MLLSPRRRRRGRLERQPRSVDRCFLYRDIETLDPITTYNYNSYYTGRVISSISFDCNNSFIHSLLTTRRSSRHRGWMLLVLDEELICSPCIVRLAMVCALRVGEAHIVEYWKFVPTVSLRIQSWRWERL